MKMPVDLKFVQKKMLYKSGSKNLLYFSLCQLYLNQVILNLFNLFSRLQKVYNPAIKSQNNKAVDNRRKKQAIERK